MNNIVDGLREAVASLKATAEGRGGAIGAHIGRQILADATKIEGLIGDITAKLDAADAAVTAAFGSDAVLQDELGLQAIKVEELRIAALDILGLHKDSTLHGLAALLSATESLANSSLADDNDRENGRLAKRLINAVHGVWPKGKD